MYCNYFSSLFFSLSFSPSLPPLSIIFSVDDDSIQGQWLKQQQDKDEFLQQPFTELAARAQYYSKNEEEEEEEEEEERGRPPPPKRFDPYGSWQTVAVR